MTLLNQCGNLDDPHHRTFEAGVGKDVRTYLQSLLANGNTIADVRMAMHHLALFLYGIESKVVLKEQNRQRREKARLKRSDDALDRLRGKTPK